MTFKVSFPFNGKELNHAVSAPTQPARDETSKSVGTRDSDSIAILGKMKKSTATRNSQNKLNAKGLLLSCLLLCGRSSAFVNLQGVSRTTSLLYGSPEDEITRQLERARQVLAKSKAKLEKADRSNNEEELKATGDATPTEIPFFATSVSMNKLTKRERVTKTTNEETGLIIADGEKMASLSETETWEMRSLDDVFENEMREKEDVNSLASKQLAERDVAASIFNLRKQMKTEDYRRIFDTRNRFIGEDT